MDESEDTLLEILKRAADRRRERESPRQVPRHVPSNSREDDEAVGPIETTGPGKSCSLDGFRLTKRARLRNPQWRSASMLDFVFENPLDGKFKDLPVVKKLLQDYPAMVRQVETSYCHHGYPYQKRTVFIGTLLGFNPMPPCPRTPCQFLRRGGTGSHPEQSTGCSARQKNSLPPVLIDLIIGSWIKRHESTTAKFLLIDVFSGWGSIETRVQERWPQVMTYANDIVSRPKTDTNLDMSADSIFTPAALLMFSLRKLCPEDEQRIQAHPGGVVGWVQQEKIAVLFHCSTPCRTYSTQALAIHRHKGTAAPKTPDAVRDDEMNSSLISFFRRVVLT